MSETKTKLFTELSLSADILKAVDKLGFEQAAPIQAETIPLLLQGKDVVGQSQTGSGKTAAFAIPAIEKTDPRQRAVQALILCPTRELAIQVAEEVHKLSLFKRGLHALPIYGGQSYERQFYGLRQGAQIVIGTPGRVMDHIRRETLHLENVRLVILDEADVMLDMGFREDIEFILEQVPKTRQTVFFSATMPRPIQELIQRFAREPVYVQIEQKTVTVPTVEQVYYEVDRRFKIELLTRLIDIHDYRLGIIFCNTKRMVDDLVDHLETQGYSADRLHGDMSQAMRDRVMTKFRKSGLEFLVATDVAARGIDVDDVQVVFNFDLPYDVQDYVHRIGRTGRAGRSGRAISFVAGRELFQIQHIERFTRMRIRRAKIPTSNEVEEARANVFLERLRVTLQGGQFQKQDHLMERLLEEGFSSADIVSALIHQLQNGGESSENPPPNDRASAASDDRRRPAALDKRPRSDRPERVLPAKPIATPAPPARLTMPAPVPAAPAQTVAATKSNRPERDVPTKPGATPALAVGLAPATPVPAAPAQTVASTKSDRPERDVAAKPEATPAPAVGLATPTPIPVVPALPSRATKPNRPERAVPTKPGATPAPAVGLATATPKPVAPTPPVASTKPLPPTPRPVRPSAQPHATTEPVIRPVKHVPPPKPDQVRLHVNIGAEAGMNARSLGQVIAGETGLPGTSVGAIDVRDRYSFVDVSAEHANAIIAKLNRSRVLGRRLKVKTA